MTSSLLTEEMHEVMEVDIDWFAHHGFKIKGVVHVGANTGQEIASYLDKLYLPVLAFEPNPSAFKELHRIYGNVAFCSNMGLGSENGFIKLRVPEDGNTERGSKYISIPTEGHDWTKVPVGEEIEIPIVRFDFWAKTYSQLLDIRAYDTLVLDVQGMELEALKGFGRYLEGFHFLAVECSATPVYDGEASADEVIEFLSAKGFKQMTPTLEHDDIIFKRRGIFD